MKRHLWLTLGLAVWASALDASAATPEVRFDQAQRQFEHAQALLEQDETTSLEARQAFHTAAEQFAALARDGVRNVNLYVNTGNALHFAGDDGRALLWYLRATELANTQEVRDGLVFLRRRCGTVARPGETGSVRRLLLVWHYDLPGSIKQWIVLAFFPAGCLLLLIALFTTRRQVLLRVGIGMIGIGLVMGLSDVVATVSPGETWGVVVEATPGHAGDADSYSIVTERIAPGQEVRILERRSDWLHIATPDETRCWIAVEACEPIALTTDSTP